MANSEAVLWDCKAGVRRSIMLANFCGRGLVSWENRPMKSLNHDTRHFWRHDSDDKKWQTINTHTLRCMLAIVTDIDWGTCVCMWVWRSIHRSIMIPFSKFFTTIYRLRPRWVFVCVCLLAWTRRGLRRLQRAASRAARVRLTVLVVTVVKPRPHGPEPARPSLWSDRTTSNVQRSTARHMPSTPSTPTTVTPGSNWTIY